MSSPPSPRELHLALSITHISQMKKARPRWTSQCVRARPQLSHCAPPTPARRGLGADPKGPSQVTLPGSCGSLPAHMPADGGPVARPQRCDRQWKSSPGREAQPTPLPAWAPCIFNNVHYSCFVTGKEPEQLTEEPRTAGRAEQWACSTLQPLPRPPGALPLPASQHRAVPQVCYHPPHPWKGPLHPACRSSRSQPALTAEPPRGVGHPPGAQPCRSPHSPSTQLPQAQAPPTHCCP